MVISIHTSAREVTASNSADLSQRQFQSTLPQGKWRQSPQSFPSPDTFQSTLPQGKWQIKTTAKDKDTQFQSTLPQGKWLNAAVSSAAQWDFNPHFRKGSDIIGDKIVPLAGISIHTSAREVTYRWVYIDFIFTYFNPHFRKGSDTMQEITMYQNTLFQSTLPQGKWLQYSTKTSVYFYEISINIFEFTFVYYWNTLSIQKAHSNLFIFTGASLPVILCMLDTRTCKL